MKNLKERGITLIALVVTIIILLILAGVSLTIALSENGLFSQGKRAINEHTHATVKESLEMKATEHILAKEAGYTSKSLIEYLEEKTIITKVSEGKYKINVTNLVGNKLDLGNGTDGTDVYMLEKIVNLAELGKVASMQTVKLAEANISKEEYEINYYGKGETEKLTLGIIKNEIVSDGDGTVTFRLVYSGLKEDNSGLEGDYTATKGTTYSEWLENNGWTFAEDAGFYYKETDYSTYISDISDPSKQIQNGDVCSYQDPAECISADALVTVSMDGKTKLAKDIKDGDDILFYDFETNSVEVGVVKKAFGFDWAKNFIKYTFNDGTTLKVTDYHPIYTKKGWKSYTERNGYPLPEIGDEVKTASGWKKLIKVEELPNPEACYNFLVKTKNGDSVKNFFANDVLVEAVTKIE